jgi:hypothetical protein
MRTEHTRVAVLPDDVEYYDAAIHPKWSTPADE